MKTTRALSGSEIGENICCNARTSSDHGYSNELNASYAADGYARVKWQSIGVLLTTYVHTISILLHASYLTIMR